jgi:putative membrane protein
MGMLATMSTLAASPGPWRDGHHGGGLWWIFPLFWGLFWVALVTSGFYLLRRRMALRGPRAGAEAVLAERFARGEVSEDEYRERLAVLRK